MVWLYKKKFWCIEAILVLEKNLRIFVPLIDNELKKTVPENSFPNFYDAMNYVFDTGGKRLRPALCLSVCKILGCDIEKALPFAVAIEIAHNALLVHDDIEDGDGIRRGKLAVWKKYGLAHGINIGDGLFFKSYEVLLSSKKKLPENIFLNLAKLFTDFLTGITEGQNMEFNFLNKKEVSVEEYMEMTWKKSGSLLALALCGGAVIAERSDLENPLFEYAKKIGPAFQIRDDVLNLIGKKETYGKEIGGDIKEGKRTLIIIHCLSKCNKKEKDTILSVLKRSRNEITDEEVKTVIGLIKKYGSIGFSQKYSEKLVEEANSLLKKLDNDELKKLLIDFSDLIIKRNY